MRALAAMYIRMTFSAVEVYELLEPLMKDYRKLRYRDTGVLIFFFFSLVHVLQPDSRVFTNSF